MPAATTHLQSAIDIYNLLPDDIKNKIKNLNMFYLGSQGPDFFFFNNFGFFNSLSDIGNYMHEFKIYEVVEYMYNFCKNDKDLLSYFYGYLCHYSLDIMVHPLVYHRSRYANLSNTDEEIITHFRIEAFYDKCILEKKNKKFDTHILLKVNNSSAKKLANMYQNLFKDILGKNISFNKIKITCSQVVFALKVLNPTSYKKFKFIEKIENLLGIAHKISSLMIYNEFKDKNDYVLNINKEEFFNINDKSLKYNKSFYELYEDGVNKAVYLITNPLNKEDFKLDFEGKIKK